MNLEVENKSKKIAVWAITKSGYKHGLNLVKNIDGSRLFISETLIEKLSELNKMDSSFFKNLFVFSELKKKIKEVFNEFDGHVFIFSTGIAVRMIAPLIKTKIEDPAVVVLDDKGYHSISLLSGHIGGANDLARKVGKITTATSVITTATDIHGKASIDTIATKHHLHIINPSMIKKINMAILEEKTIKIDDSFNILYDKVPNSVCEQEEPDIICTDFKTSIPRGTLVLNPESLVVGIGCNRETSFNEIESFLLKVLKKNRLSLKSIWAFASIDAKNNEKGLLELSDKYRIQFLFISKQELESVKNIKNPSKMVQKHMGIESVCEAAAIKAGNNAKLIIQKQIKKNVTIAIARKDQCSI